MNLKIGDSCYIIAECFGYRGKGYHYQILKGTVRNIPRGNLHEYDITYDGKIYGRKERNIYTDYNTVVNIIDEMADDYDYVYIRVETEDDADTVLDAVPFFYSVPLAVCGDEAAISHLMRYYCGKLAVIADNA